MTTRRDETMDLLLDELEAEVDAAPTNKLPTPPSAPNAPPPPMTKSTVPEPVELPSDAAVPVTPGTRPSQMPTHIANARAAVLACEHALRDGPDPQRAAQLHFEAARIYETPLREPGRAREHYDRALHLRPDHRPTLRGARRARVAVKDYREALPLFATESRLVPDAKSRALLFLQKGRLLEDQLGNPGEARSAYAQAFELDQSNPAILRALLRRCRAAGDHEEVDRLLAHAAATWDAEREPLLMLRAATLDQRLGKREQAAELYETVLRNNPKATAARMALKRLYHDHAHQGDRLRALESEAQHAETPRQQAAAWLQIGHARAALGERDAAIRALVHASDARPEDGLVLEALARQYELAGDHQSLRRVLSRLVALKRAPQDRFHLLFRTGHLCETLELHDDAIEAYEHALRLSPASVPTLQALGSLYGRLERYEDLARMYAREAEVVPVPRRRAAAYVRLADLQERELQDIESALENHQRALTAVSGYAPAFKAIARLLADAGRYKELVRVHERAVAEAKSTARAITHLFEIAHIEEDSLGDSEAAVRTFQRILAIDPENLVALHGLERAAERAHDDQTLVDALNKQANLASDAGLQVSLWHRAGEIAHDRLKDADLALRLYRQTLDVDPAYAPSLMSLGRLHHERGRWEDLLAVYERELENDNEGPGAAALLHKMGVLARDRIGREDDARAFFERALDAHDMHAPSLHALTDILRKAGDTAGLAKLIERRIASSAHDEDAAALRYHLGAVHEATGALDEAAASYARAAESPAVALHALEAELRVQAARGAPEGLLRSLVTLDELRGTSFGESTETSSDHGVEWDGIRRASLLEQALINAHALNRPKHAIECLETILEHAPNDPAALLALEPLYERLGDKDSLIEVLQTQAATLQSVAARSSAHRELARLRSVLGSPPAEVVAAWKDALRIDEHDQDALEALEASAIASHDDKLLEDLDRRLLARSQDAEARGMHALRRAEALETRGASEALSAYREALELAPQSLSGIRGLARCAKAARDPEAMAQAARLEATVSRSGQTAAALFVESAALRLSHLGQPAEARADLEEALRLFPDSRDAANAVSELLMGEERYAELAELLLRVAEEVREKKWRAELFKRAGELLMGRLGSTAGAISAYTKALKATPEDVTAILRLAEIYSEDRQWNEVVNLLGRVVRKAADRDALLVAHLRLADVLDERLGNAQRALVSVNAVLALDPKSMPALLRMTALRAKEGNLDEARAAAQRAVEAAITPGEKQEAHATLAAVHRQRGANGLARRAYLEAVAYGGAETTAADAVKSMGNSPDERRLYGDALVRFAREHATQQERPEAFIEAARVFREEAGDGARAAALLREGWTTTSDPRVRDALTVRQLADGAFGEAVSTLRECIGDQPGDISAWSRLARAWSGAGSTASARRAASMLSLLGGVTEYEEQILARSAPATAVAAPGSLAPAVLDSLSTLDAPRAAALSLLRALGPALAKIAPLDLETFGLTSRDRLKAGHPLVQTAQRLAAVFDVPEPHVYLHRAPTRGAVAQLGSHDGVLVPAWVEGAPLAEQVFALTQPLVLLGLGCAVFDARTAREVEVILAAAARSAAPGYGQGLTSEEVLDSMNSRLTKAMPWLSGRTLEDAAAQYAPHPSVDGARFEARIRRTAMRIAALLADDMAASGRAHAKLHREVAELEGAALVSASAELQDAAKFLISEPADQIRTHIGHG